MTKPSAALVYIHPGEVAASFAYCAMRLMVYEIGRTSTVPVLIAQRCASGQLVEARNETVTFFLDNTPCDWMFVVDSDMGFAHDTLEQLIGSADPQERPVMGALCFGLKKVRDDGALQAVEFRHFPTIYRCAQTDDDIGFLEQHDYPRDALVQCDATGAACFVVHRTVLETMRAQFGDNWFSKAHLPGPSGEPKVFSEDLSFFLRVAQAGFPTWVNTAVKTSHDKGGVFLTEESYDQQQMLQDVYKAMQETSDPLEFDSLAQPA